MTLQDLPASLSMIAERHLSRAKAALEELGIDTAGMPPAEIFDRAQGEGASAGHPLKPESLERESERQSRRAQPARIASRWNRAWRRDWRRRSRSRLKIANGTRQD